MWGFLLYVFKISNLFFGYRYYWKNKIIFMDEWENMIEYGLLLKEIW